MARIVRAFTQARLWPGQLRGLLTCRTSAALGLLAPPVGAPRSIIDGQWRLSIGLTGNLRMNLQVPFDRG